jgi:4a-hydroxytetrahydrobiopterin dehydratase
MEKLSDSEVNDALARMPEWKGDTERIARTVTVSGGAAEALSTEVMSAADAMDHHPVIDITDEAMTFTVWTHSEGGVTNKDLVLAARIDELVAGQAHPDTGS